MLRKKALAWNDPPVVIPYSQIAWTYMGGSEDETMRTVFIRTKDGRRFMKEMYVIEYALLLDEVLKFVCPEMIVGIGPEEQKLYYTRYPESLKKYRSPRVIWGHILAIFACIVIIAGFVNGTAGDYFGIVLLMAFLFFVGI